MDLRRSLDIGVSEDGIGTDTHGRLERTKDRNKTVTRSTKGGQEIQGEESGGVD